jgi:hypothetical protein
MEYKIKPWELNIDMELIQSAEDELSRDIDRYIELMLKSDIKTQFMFFGFILDHMEFEWKADILSKFPREVFLDMKSANHMEDEDGVKVMMDKYGIGDDEYSHNTTVFLNFEGIAKWIIDNSISSIREEKLNKIGI